LEAAAGLSPERSSAELCERHLSWVAAGITTAARAYPEMVTGSWLHRIRQAEAQIAARILWQDHGLIFASEVKTPMDPDNFSHSFSRLCERAGPDACTWREGRSPMRHG